MKNLFHFAFFCILGTGSLYASDKTADGYYITNANDTLRATFKVHTDFGGNLSISTHQSTEVKIVDALGKKAKLRAKDIKKYNFEFDNKYYTFVAVPMSWQPAFPFMIFLYEEVSGYCQLFKYFQTNNSVAGRHEKVESPVFRKNGGECYLVDPATRLTNGTTPKSYFSDCPRVVDFIENGHKKDYHEMATLYNLYCGGK